MTGPDSTSGEHIIKFRVGEYIYRRLNGNQSRDTGNYTFPFPLSNREHGYIAGQDGWLR